MGISALKSTSKMRFSSICSLPGVGQRVVIAARFKAALGPPPEMEVGGCWARRTLFWRTGTLAIARRRASLEPDRGR